MLGNMYSSLTGIPDLVFSLILFVFTHNVLISLSPWYALRPPNMQSIVLMFPLYFMWLTLTFTWEPMSVLIRIVFTGQSSIASGKIKWEFPVWLKVILWCTVWLLKETEMIFFRVVSLHHTYITHWNVMVRYSFTALCGECSNGIGAFERAPGPSCSFTTDADCAILMWILCTFSVRMWYTQIGK